MARLDSGDGFRVLSQHASGMPQARAFSKHERGAQPVVAAVQQCKQRFVLSSEHGGASGAEDLTWILRGQPPMAATIGASFD